MATIPSKQESANSSEVLETYEKWNQFGYYVKKGEKARKFNKCGLALFGEDQVEELSEQETNSFD